MQAQCILFRRYPDVLAPFKYGGYPLLLSAVTLPEDSEETNAAHFLGPEKAPLLEVCPFSSAPLRCQSICFARGPWDTSLNTTSRMTASLLPHTAPGAPRP